MDEMGVKFDNIDNILQQGDRIVPIIRKWGHPWRLLSQEQNLAYNHLTDVELRRLHRRFGHPSVQRLYRVLSQAGNDVEIAAIEHLTKYCHHCQLHGRAPNRFKFTLRDDYHFNYEIAVDVMYLEGNKPVLHVVDTATTFQAARFLKDVSAKHTWEALRLCWIDVYQGPPDWITTDAGRNFHAQEFRQSARSMGISIKEVPVEAHNSIGKVERYHAALRRAYEIIRAESPSTPPEAALQSALKAINDTAGPEGIVPTLLVFGAYPRMTEESPPSPDITARAEAIRKATKEVQKLHAQRQIADGLAMRNGPITTSTLDLPLQSLVRVWRESNGWQGPYRLIAVDGERCTLELPHGPVNFRSTAVKPYHRDGDTPEEPHQQSDHIGGSEQQPPEEPFAEEPTGEKVSKETTALSPGPTRRTRGRSRKHPIARKVDNPVNQDDEPIEDTIVVAHVTSKEEADMQLAIELRKKGTITTPGQPFELSTKQEIESLIDRGVFEFVPFDENQHQDIRIFKSRIVNKVKGKTTQPYEKSRLVIQGYADDGKDAILTQSPTIQRASQRLILALAPSLMTTGYILWLRDITQAYVQSTKTSHRNSDSWLSSATRQLLLITPTTATNSPYTAISSILALRRAKGLPGVCWHRRYTAWLLALTWPTRSQQPSRW